MSCSPLSGVAAQHEGKSFCEAGGFFFFFSGTVGVGHHGPVAQLLS